MRIALLSYRSKPHSGGQGVYIRHLSRELALLGHRVEVFSGQPYPELDDVDGLSLVRVPSLDLYRDSDPFRTPHPREIRDWIDVLEVATMWTAGFPEPLTFSLRMARLLKRHGADFDVVHDNQCLGYGVLAIGRELPVVATVHHPITRDRDLALAEATGWRRLTVHRWHGFLRMQGRVVRRIPKLLTVSDNSAADITAAFNVDPDAITVIPLGVDTDLFAPTAERVPGRVVSIASADAPLKGVPHLLEAVAKVGAERPVELVLVSKLDPNGAASAMIDDLAIGDRVRVVSGLTDAELAELLASAEIACVPSLYEGFSLPAVEAMSCGAALVATRAGALPEVVGDAAELVDPGDSNALAQAIGELLDDPQRRQELGASGRTRVLAQYSWGAVAARTAETYRDVIADGAIEDAERNDRNSHADR